MLKGSVNKSTDLEGTSPTRKILARPCILLVTLSLLNSASCSSEKTAYVRVNQLGYEFGYPIRAYLMAAGSESGAQFAIKNSHGEAVHSAAIGAGLGTWRKYAVYALDFTVATPDTYTITISGPFPAVSPSFRVDTPENLYSGPLANALSFFENQRDGADFVPSTLRPAPAHLNDKRATVYSTPEFSGPEGSRVKGDLTATGAVIDASGGWWDAGDCLKFVHTASYTVALMLVGVRDFPNQMGAGSALSNFTKEAKFGVDWLLRMWDDRSKTLYYQVGIGSGRSFENDHSVWRLPQMDDTYGGTDPKYRYLRHRPVFVAGPAGSKISPNLAGRLAGDFALCFRLYRTSDAAYANRCLLAAQHIFDLADTAPAGNLLTAAPYDFYGETEWRDDMEFAATELYLATHSGNLPEDLPHADPQFYLQAAASWASAYIHSGNHDDGLLGVADISGLAHFELYRALALARNPGGLAVSQSDLLEDMRKKLDAAVKLANRDPFGLGFSWGGGDTPAHAAALAVMASEYDHLTGSIAYAKYSRGWLANILGANAWGTSFIVGVGSTFPYCIHHQLANLAGSKTGQPPILAGALVEGPVQEAESGAPRGVATCPPNGEDLFSRFNGNGAMYRDNAKYYSTVEPAIDLTAPSFLMLAWRTAGAPVSLSPGTSSEPH